jgi:formylglycine-generating enzyme required for sulfatase activity
VLITQGFWLFDTPCVQALWQAVMDENPSRFQSPDRPVELVSWDDVQAFLKRINARVPGLDLRLPNEAEWEHACRAGTETALYTGPIEMLGECNAPALDPIAWYGGNSGVEFDLEEGHDSSDWPETQYPHARAGTRRVKLKQPNPWGLYDMLGNVWEWCDDRFGTYPSDPVTNPRSTDGDYGVGRGGSYSRAARYARASARFGLKPGFSAADTGFRVARSAASE